MPLIDALSVPWTLPPLTWSQVAAINRVLRAGGDDLTLPHAKTGELLWDLHLPDVQQWFLMWPGAPICLGVILLGDQAKEMKLDEGGFALRWRGDACDRLREAIWEEWILYLPPAARALAAQVYRSVQETRAHTLDHLEATFSTLIEGQAIQQDASIAKARIEIAKLRSQVGLGPRETSGPAPVSSDSTPAPTV